MVSVVSSSMFLHWFPWHVPQAAMHFTLLFLQYHCLVVQFVAQLKLTNLIKFMGAIVSNLWIGSYEPSEVEYQLYSFGTWDILFKTSQSWSCKYARRECCAATRSAGRRLSGRKTPVFDYLLHWVTRCGGKGIPWDLYIWTEQSQYQH